MWLLIPENASVKEVASYLKQGFLLPFQVFGAFGLIIGELLFKLVFGIILFFLIAALSPIIPFFVAYRNRKTHPKMSKAIVWMCSITIALIILISILDTYA